MNEKDKKRISKLLSLVLRHEPEYIGLELDGNGWAVVAELMAKAAKKGYTFSREELEEVVVTNDKQRFAFDEDGLKIRANQGHSIEVDLEMIAQTPPTVLYHGTVERFLVAIRSEGLKKMSRQHVHLSKDRETAIKVGSRRGKPLILTVRAGDMAMDGFVFFLSENGVWLTDAVPAKYIDHEA
jgi:putative RNA 2'-phosphotransferase